VGHDPSSAPTGITESTTADTDAKRAQLRRGATVDRYMIIGRLGGGGMGEVYSAYDPELDRKVAIKLLRADARSGQVEQAKMRLLREAQAMARLSHPNVIAVYDAGTFGDEVFVAMELVEGRTLSAWLEERSRSIREIVAAYADAGRGLAAAHSAGLIHRDFKPENVLVGHDGRVRVLDFGLARAANDSPERAPSAFEDTVADSGRAALLTPLTQDGAFLGTPGYMSPEQFVGSSVDARSDQFSFCVALYRALYGERPFGGTTVTELMLAVNSGAVRAAPKKSRVPFGLRKVLIGGLSVRPENRFVTMDALLAELSRDPGAARKRQLVAVGLVVFCIVAGLGLGAALRHHRGLCAGAESRLVGVWDDARRAAVRASFLQSGQPYAQAVLSTVEHAFDAYARAWVTLHIDACEATHVRGEQSQEMLDLRMTCLSDRLTQLGTLSEIYTHADADTIERAAESVGALPGLEACADAVALRAPISPPADAEVRRRVQRIRDQIARAEAHQLAGHYDEGSAIARAALTEAVASAYKPVEAEAQLTLGNIFDGRGNDGEASRAYHDAYVAAVAGRHDQVAGSAAIQLVHMLDERQARYDEADRWADIAEATVGRLQERADLLGWLYIRRAMLRDHQGRYDNALADAQRAVDRQVRRFGTDHPNVAVALHILSGIYDDRAQYTQALDSSRRALAINERALGADHPSIAVARTGLGDVYGDSGQHAEALVQYQLALTVLQRLNPDHPNAAIIYNNMGDELIKLGRFDEAVDALERSLVRWRKRRGASQETTMALANLGEAELGRNRLDEAAAYFRTALVEAQPVLGPEHSLLGIAQWGLGEVARRKARLDEAQLHFERAVVILEKALGPIHPNVARPLVGLGRVALSRRQWANGLAPLERAVAIRQGQPGDGKELAESRFALAQALWMLGERGRAIELAAKARQALEAIKAENKGGRDTVAEVVNWQASHGNPRN
jgi:tetratricopeptide (TPR) repeat protein